MGTVFEPKIVAFLCNWCSYAGADLAGSTRREYPPNVFVIRVPCSGRVGPEQVLRAFLRGADGVLVAGCHPGDCHYLKGNLAAERRVKSLYWLIDLLNIDRRRFRLEWISASEGAKFASVAREFTKDVRGLGPSNIRLSEADYQTALRMASWMEALDAVSESVERGEEPPCKGVVFSQAFRLSVPYRSQVPAAQSWIVADPSLCVGCRICEAVCSLKHEGEVNPALARLRIVNESTGPLARIKCLQDVCRQCKGADCVAACPTGALHVDPVTGARVIDGNLCIGCRNCEEACQWKMISYAPAKNVCFKCDLCGGDPACVDACPAGALKLVVTERSATDDAVRMAG